MRYEKLGRTDMRVSVVGLGCWALAGGSVWGDQDERDSLRTIHAALDCGINFFDTAEAYGNSEEIVGRGLQGKRDQVVLATKASPSHLAPRALMEACEGSLRSLNTEYIDLYQLHWPNREVPIDDTIEALGRLREQGKIRAAGVSNFGAQDLGELLQVGRVEANQVPYNLLWRAVEYSILPLCIGEEIGVMCYSPLAQGLLTGKFRTADDVPEARARSKHFSGDRERARHGGPGFETATFETIRRVEQIADDAGVSMAALSLSWLVHQKGVASVLAGGRRPEQVKQNAAAASLELSPDMLHALDAATRELKQKFGDDADMWDDRIR